MGLTVELGAKRVTFTRWDAKLDSPGEYAGFRFRLDGADEVSYLVKAGTEVFASSDRIWSHPAGASGPDAKGISNVDFCDDDGGGSDDGGGDDGGDDDGGDDDGGDDDGGDDDCPPADDTEDDDPTGGVD